MSHKQKLQLISSILFYFQIQQEYILDVDTGRVGRPQNTVLVVRFYLQSILQLSLSYDISKAMVHQGLLTLLWRIVRAFPKETELLTLCTQIVANLSLHPTLHLYIFQSGKKPKITKIVFYIIYT